MWGSNMKKVSLTIFVLLFFNFFLFSKSEFRSIEATSSSKNPGVVKVKTNYKTVDDQGHEKSTSQTKNFSTKDGSSYVIKLSDDGSDILFEENGRFDSVNPFSRDDSFDDFFNFNKKFDQMFEEAFGSNNVRNNYSTKPAKAKIAPPEIMKEKKVDKKKRPDADVKKYTPQQVEVLKYIEQLKKEYDL